MAGFGFVAYRLLFFFRRESLGLNEGAPVVGASGGSAILAPLSLHLGQGFPFERKIEVYSKRLGIWGVDSQIISKV